MKSNFLQRTITGAVFVAIILGAVWFGAITFLVLLLAVCVGGLSEYARLFKGRDIQPSAPAMVSVGTALFLLLNFAHLPPLLLFAPVALLFFIVELYGGRPHPWERAALGIAGLLYIPASLYLFIYIANPVMHGCFSLKQQDYIWQLPAGIFFLIWASDTFAYLAGRAFGRTPLFPRVSPKKTWEGWVGGLVGTLAIGLLLFYVWGIFSLGQWMALAAVIVVCGTLGDLVESMLKRSLNKKDSGNMIPGHGGVLDRFDSLLIAMPFVALLIELFKWIH
jgi:phosphatidate cytidylyltransferase